MSGEDTAPQKTRPSVMRPYQRGLLTAVIMGLVLVPLVLMAAVFEINREFGRGRDLRAVVDRSYEERSQLQTVFSLLQDAETGQRGYIITGNKSYLEPLNSADVKIGPALAKLKAMQSTGSLDYPRKAKLMAQLNDLAVRRVRGAHVAVNLRDTKGENAAQDFVMQGRGKFVMDQIRVIVAEMDAGNQQALNARVNQSQGASHSSEGGIIAMFAALGAVLIAAYALVIRQAHGRQKLLLQAQTAATRQTAIFESAQDGILIFNPSGTIESMNRAAETMFARNRADVVRRDIGLLLDLPADQRLFLERLSAGQDLGAGITREFSARRSDGELFPVEASLGLISLPEGDRVVAALRDISERKRVEVMKAEFISTVSHELRTPLTSIAGSLGLLLGGAVGDLPEKAGRLLGIAHGNCQRLVRLINDILDIEKMESGKMSFNLEPQDLGELARRCVDGIAGMAVDTKVKVTLDAVGETPRILGDPDRLSQVITNLLSNAVKFSPPGGVVEVSVVAPVKGRLQLRVRDHGPGIPEAFRGRIFSKFAQADSSDTRQKGGTGLGLVISREIAERHGGTLSFESTPGDGACFILDLPVMNTLRAPAKAAGGANTRQPRILICEDDPDIAEILSESLKREGLHVETVGTIAAAEKALSGRHPYLALLLDVRLPDGNGLDLLDKLRRDPRTARLPITIISAEAGAGHALDVVDWLEKPVDLNRLRQAVTAAIAGSGRKGTRVLHVEDDADVRQIVSDALSPGCSVIGVEGVAAARKALQLTTPDLVILDLGLSDGSGVELLPDLKYPDGRRMPVVIFSAQSLNDRALIASVDAVLTKSKMSLDQLAETVRDLASLEDSDLVSGLD